MRTRTPRRPACILLVFLALGCGGGGTPSEPDPPSEPVATTLEIVSGNDQTGVVGAVLETSITVRVLSNRGGGMAGQAVSVSTDDGGSFDPASGTTEVELDRWGDTATVSVEVTDEFGNTVPSPPLRWSSSDTAVARVGTDGTITSWTAGSVEVAATLAASTSSSSSEGGTAVDFASVPVGVAGAGEAAFAPEGSVQVTVAVQRNSACAVPGPPGSPGGVAPVPTWHSVPDAFGGAQLQENGIRPASGDFDGDGGPDVVVGDYDPSTPEAGRLLVWRNTGGTFEDATEALLGPDPVPVDGTRRVEVSDFSGDGMPDLFTAHQGFDAEPFPGAPNVLLHSRSAPPMADVSTSHLVPNDPAGFTHGAESADFDCDGDVDLFTSDIGSATTSPSAHLHVNRGDGFLDADAALLPPEIAGGELVVLSAASCDLDRDGDRDMILGRSGSSNPDLDSDHVLVNDGFGSFRRVPAEVPASPFGSFNTTSDLACEDVDRDGWPDVILGNASGDAATEIHLSVWMNRGALRFEDVVLFEQTSDAMLMDVRDVNGDGWPDIIREFGPEGLLVNRGGSFLGAPLPHDGALAWLDADQDGLLDAVWPGIGDEECCPPELHLQGR